VLNNRSRDVTMAAPPRTDDLQRIDGIGQGIANRLYKAGVYTFADLAGLSLDQLISYVGKIGGLSAERIAREDWIGQARALAEAEEAALLKEDVVQPEALETFDDSEIAGIRRRNATFTTKLVLNEDHEVNYTRVVHLESMAEDAWVGWQGDRLNDFFVRYANLRLDPAAIVEPAAMVEAAELAPVDRAPELEAPQTSLPPANGLSGELRLDDLEISNPGTAGARSIISAGQPIEVVLAVDCSEVVAPGDIALGYLAAVYAKSLAGGSRQTLGEARGALVPTGRVLVALQGMAPPQGIYRLEAMVTLETTAPSLGSDLVAFLEGGLLQVC
jgi:hypothetical protein